MGEPYIRLGYYRVRKTAEKGLQMNWGSQTTYHFPVSDYKALVAED